MSSNNPIEDLRRSYTRNLQRERIGDVVAFLGFWFLFSFVILFLSPLFLRKALALPLAAALGSLAVCILWLLRSKIF